MGNKYKVIFGSYSLEEKFNKLDEEGYEFLCVVPSSIGNESNIVFKKKPSITDKIEVNAR